VVYVDRGVSVGMAEGVREAARLGQAIEYRDLASGRVIEYIAPTSKPKKEVAA